MHRNVTSRRVRDHSAGTVIVCANTAPSEGAPARCACVAAADSVPLRQAGSGYRWIQRPDATALSCSFRISGWRAAEMPKLWGYHLHYFDYLLWPSYSFAGKTELFDDWIVRVPPSQGDG